MTGAFCLSLVGLVMARDVTTFLGFWELMTLLPAALILIGRHDEPARRDVFAYLAITHLGGVGVWVSMLVLADHGALAGVPLHGDGLRGLVAIAAIIGFCTKAGAVPLHSWLPRAHPLAPAQISGLMSGVMIKVALYGLIRVLFEWDGPTPLWVGLTLLGLGVLSALGGVLYALFQNELKRLLAFSSIENVGIILLGLGASLVFAAIGRPQWSAIAFAAALLHVLNHAIFKALLFLGAGSFAAQVGGLGLDGLGGLLRRMPWTGAAFMVGAAAIAGVPPLNGFISEWMILQSLLHLSLFGRFGVSLVAAASAAALGATAALAVFCFVKVIGLVLLGPPRTTRADAAREAGVGMRWPLVLLASLCLLLGIIPGVLVPTLERLHHHTGLLSVHAGVDLPGTGGLPALPLALALTLLTVTLWRSSRNGRAEPTPAWTCGQATVPALAWTSAGFTKPLRILLENVLRPTRDLTIVHSESGVIQELRYEADVPHLFDSLIYEPVTTAALRMAGRIRRLQSGSLRTYLVYLLGLLMVLLALVQLGVLT
ncbi:proton-conducting transporter membrane subunit [Conexibacter sp. DBS9H8]|uniref:proton-conducting transporter transmembrane domain-containing protein n=1 Tax=Conexibacter sp. DBS9H8 TaxID=2937801 RepID=UPI00200E7A85|nr:proton-conducting transporter membrane subunit [Conexibacter sp. DBS9H8]